MTSFNFDHGPFNKDSMNTLILEMKPRAPEAQAQVNRGQRKRKKAHCVGTDHMIATANRDSDIVHTYGRILPMHQMLHKPYRGKQINTCALFRPDHRLVFFVAISQGKPQYASLGGGPCLAEKKRRA